MLSSAYSIGAIVKNSLRVEPDHLRDDLPLEAGIELFRRHVELIEVETTSYCNRTCSFCPNQFIDRRSEKHPMPVETWAVILAGLRQVGYDGTFVWSRYSEPLSDRGILDQIRSARQAAPACRLAVNTNGDYLDSGYIDDLAAAGLDRMFVDIYLPDDDVYDLAIAKAHHERFLKRIGRTAEILAESPEFHARVASAGLEITTTVRNAAALRRTDTLSDRGGLISLGRRATRVAPCYAPYKHLVIDWDGSLMVCCQVRSDSPVHANAVLGRVGTGEGHIGLVQAYIRLAAWRASLWRFGPKASPCTNCNVYEYRSNPITRTAARVLGATSPGAMIVKRVLAPLIAKKQRW